MSKIFAAITYSAIGQYTVHIVGFAAIIVISRLLTPEEIGVIAVATAVYLLGVEHRPRLIRSGALSGSDSRALWA